MCSDISMSFFIPVVFLDVMQIISSNNYCVVHFVGNTHSSEDPASDRNVSGKRTFLINIMAFDRLFRGFEPKSDIFVISYTFFSRGR